MMNIGSKKNFIELKSYFAMLKPKPDKQHVTVTVQTFLQISQMTLLLFAA